MIWLLIQMACQDAVDTRDLVELTATEKTTVTNTAPSKPPVLTKKQDYPVQDGMVHVPEGLVDLGPRHVEAVKGYTLPMNPTGMTPNMGEGDNQRAAGGPPLPPGPNGGPPGGPPNGAQFPQHKPKFDLNTPHSGGVGHVRPGSGVPSAPPNMPGSQAKFVGDEQPWTANPSNQMKSKRVIVSTFWIDLTEITRIQYKEFLEATGYRPPFIAEEWAKDGWNWDGSNYPEGTGEHPVVMVSWYDAQEYCAWRGKRLPTEAEWQLAALGDVRLGYDFPWGKEYNHDALNHGKIESPNFDDSDGYLHTSPVGAFPAGRSVYGLDDVFGNAWEFTADARRATWKFYDNADGDTPSNTMAPGPSLYVGVRGGAYFFDLRPNPGGERNEFLTEVRRKTAGFRCAKS